MTLLWTVSLSSEATSDYNRLDKSIASSVDAALKKLTANPEMRGYPLRGNLSGFRSLVVGKKKIRIVYKVIHHEIIVVVVAIGHRRDDEVYIRAGARVKESPEG
jgi:addiction module RelE/StbE family toxin